MQLLEFVRKGPVKSEQREVLEINMTKFFLSNEDFSDIEGPSCENFFISF